MRGWEGMQPAKNCRESGSNASLKQLKDLTIKLYPVSSEHQTSNSEGVFSSLLLGVQIQLIQSRSRRSALAGEEGGAVAAAPWIYGCVVSEIAVSAMPPVSLLRTGSSP